jgi:protein-disulfide isomerase
MIRIPRPYGPEKAKVAVIEFFDYQCVFCNRFAPELEKVMKAQPDVRYVFKEWPIFGSRWPESLQAAQQGLSVWKQKGAQAYVTYHNALRHWAQRGRPDRERYQGGGVKSRTGNASAGR